MKSNINNGYTFQEALQQKSTIKIDVTLLIDDKFIEITDNYFFTINDYKTFERLKSILQVEGNNKREIKLLNDFFNSKVGYLYTIWSEISVISQLLELKKKVDEKDIYDAIQRMKEDISFFPL